MEVVKNYEAGDLIFKQGDVGDAMLLIRSGSVEVFRESSQGEVLLTVQGAGEAVGMLTFFTGAQRLASARARTPVAGQVISRVNGQDPLAKLPPWVQVLLKEFAVRLEQINDQFARSQHAKSEIQNRLYDAVFISCQLASTLATLAPLRSRKLASDKEGALLSELLDVSAQCLGYERRELERITDLFKSSGLIRTEREGAQEWLSLSLLSTLKWYAEFAQNARSGRNRRVVLAPLTSRHRKQLVALHDYVLKTGADPQTSYSTELSLLLEQFPRLMERELDHDSIDMAEKLELCEIKRSGDKATLNFHPADLARIVIASYTIKRLRSTTGADGDEDI